MSQQQVMVVLGANIANFQSAMSTVQNSMNNTANQIQSSMNGVEGTTINSANGIKNALKGIAGVLAGAFALDKMKDFATSSIEASAEAQAMSAQFEQVFGDIGKEAQKTIDGLGKEFGMLPSRIQPAMTQMTSMFMGLGLDTKEAMSVAERAVTAVADASAFYDKSFEDANSALNSFIKGNYEGGEAIGLFANETQLASWASKELGLDWKTLDEAGKQVARLEFAEAMLKSAGATGQASRESESYQNQLGNLKQAWTDMKAKLAEPVLEPVVKGLMKLTKWIQNIDITAIQSNFKKVGGYLKDVLKPTFDDVRDGLQLLWNKFKESGGLETAKRLFEGFKDVLTWLKNNAEVVTAVLGGLAGAFLAFKIISGINTAIGIMTTLLTALRTGTLMATLAQWGFNTALLANPITWIAVAIGALIAIVILLWKNWDSVSAWLSASWENIKAVAGVVWNGIKDTMSAVWNAITSTVKTVWNGIKSFIVGLWNGIVAVAMAVWNGIKAYFITVFNIYKTIFTAGWNAVKTATTTVWNGISNGIKTAIDKIKGFFTGMWDKAKEIADKIKGAFSGLFKGIKMPKFKMSGSLNPAEWIKGNMPKLSVSWHQNGGIIKGTKGGTIVGVGENGGDEAIVPLSNKSRMKPFAQAVANMMPNQSTSTGEITNNFNIASIVIREEADIKKIAKELAKEQTKMSRAEGRR